MRVILSSNQSKYFENKIPLEKLNNEQRVARAFQKLLIFFGLAIASIFIPVFHFVLVPLFLITSVVAGFKAFQVSRVLKLPKESPCLECNQPLKSSYFLSSDLRIKCEKCFAVYRVEENPQ